MESIYVFDDRNYEEAIQDLKATMFDIVAKEEERKTELEVIINEEENNQIKEILAKLYQKQSTSLSKTITTIATLAKLIENLDSCNYELQNISNLKQQLENNGKTTENIMEAPVNEPVTEVYQNEVNSFPETVEAMPTSPAVEQTPVVNVQPQEPLPEPQNQNVGQEEVVQTEPVNEVSTVDSQPEITSQPEVSQPEPSQSEIAPEENNSINLPPLDIPSEDTNSANELSSPASQPETNPSEEVAKEEPPQEEPQPVMSETPGPEEVTPEVVPQAEAEPVISEATTPEEVTQEEPPQAEAEPVISEPTIPEEVTQEVAPQAEITEETSVPVLPPLDIPDESSSNTISPSEPVTTNAETNLQNATNTPEPNEDSNEKVNNVDNNKIKFKKQGNDSAKAILVTTKQISKLSLSRKNQTSLLETKGILPEKSSSSETNPSTNQKLEQLLEKANQLYSEGKIQESEELFNEISSLNKEIQNEETVSKTA